MALFNYASKEITLKVVYYGPGLSGKTTNLQYLHSILNPSSKGKMLSLATEADRTLFFDFLPVELGRIRDFSIRFQLYTVPGQVRYNATRKVVLKGADAVVFVADSQQDMQDQNIESFDNMRENLTENNINPDDIPIVLQFNKRDLKNISSIDELNGYLNSYNYPYFEASAVSGVGVEETFKHVTKLLMQHIAKKHKIQIQPAREPEHIEEPPTEPARIEKPLGMPPRTPKPTPAAPMAAETMIDKEEPLSWDIGKPEEPTVLPEAFEPIKIEEKRKEEPPIWPVEEERPVEAVSAAEVAEEIEITTVPTPEPVEAPLPSEAPEPPYAEAVLEPSEAQVAEPLVEEIPVSPAVPAAVAPQISADQIDRIVDEIDKLHRMLNDIKGGMLLIAREARGIRELKKEHEDTNLLLKRLLSVFDSFRKHQE